MVLNIVGLDIQGISLSRETRTFIIITIIITNPTNEL